MLSLLARASLEGALLAACVWIACRALPRLSPAVRALLWWCVAAKFLVALLWVSPIALPILPAAAGQAPVEDAGSRAPTLALPEAGAGVAPAGVESTASASDGTRDETAISWSAILLGLWGLGFGLAFARSLRSWQRTRAVVARSLPDDTGLDAVVRDLSTLLGMRRAADVRWSAEIESPLITGVRRPVILVPADRFAALSPDQQRMALCHELAHLKRGDVWLGCIPAAVERCFFFHPLARLAAREYAFWREAACDEAVLSALGASPRNYGHLLLALGVSRQPATFSAAGAALSFPNLKRRVSMLTHRSSPSLGTRLLAAGAVAVTILAMAPVRTVARSAEPAAIAPTQTQARVPAKPAAPPPEVVWVDASPAAAQAHPSGTAGEPTPPIVVPSPDRSAMLPGVVPVAERPSAPPGAVPAAAQGAAPPGVVRARAQRSSEELRYVYFHSDTGSRTMITMRGSDD